ncbi:hypothetical protein ACLESO_50805, partial [Pyxidicoccus sp. 3LG]
FFVLSTTGPLLQSWFARARPGTSPYPLYALSNVGSLLALLGYPFLVEPWVGRGAQAWGWGVGFVLFTVACAVCAVDVLKHAGTEAAPAPATAAPGEARGWRGRHGAPSRRADHPDVAGAERLRVRAAAGDDEPALTGRGGRPLPVGAAAGHLPRHLHPRVRP